MELINKYSNVWPLFLLLIILFFGLIFYLEQFYGTSFLKNRVLKPLNKIYLMIHDKIYFKLYYELLLEGKFMSTMKFLVKKINTKEIKIVIFILFNLLPKFIFISALFWDININQEVYYSLWSVVFLVFPLIFNMCFRLLETFSTEAMDTLQSVLFVFVAEDEDDGERFICFNLKMPCLETVDLRWVVVGADLFPHYCDWVDWCEETKKLIEKINIILSIIFVCLQILCQIYFITQQIYY